MFRAMANTSTAGAVPARAPTFRSPAARWRAVRDRDLRADGCFLYAVATTGIYCRPSCPSRRPLARNVAYFDTAVAAAAAGYRACQRCHPDGAATAQRRSGRIAQLCRLIDAAEAMPSLAVLAQAAALSRFHLAREFKAVTGVTPREYYRRRRQLKVEQGLRGDGRITDALLEAGYGSSGRFYAESGATLGMTPRQFRAGGAQLTVHYATAPCSLGHVLAAATPRGLCAILLGDAPELLRQDLERRFPRATLVPAPADFDQQLQQVAALVETPALHFALPLDIQGTAFQQRVWAALRSIPAGSTASYTEIATRIQAPRAVRAVAQACGANPLAIAVPCHRVLRNDGGLSGYRWGVERKRELLRRERKTRT